MKPAKIPSWDETEEIAPSAALPSWDDTEEIANPGNTKPEVSTRPPEMGLGEAMARSALPRSFKAEEEGAGFLRKAGAGALDALSLPGRTLASVASAKTEGNPYAYAMGGSFGLPKEAQRFEVKSAEPIGETMGDGVISRTLRDPALLPSLALGGPAAKLAGKGLAAGAQALGLGAKAAPAAAQAAGRFASAGRLAKDLGATAGRAALQAGTTGAIEGAGSAAIHQADRLAQGQDVDLGDAATEIAYSAILPAVISGSATLAKEAGKETAKAIMQTALKPSKQLMQGRGSKLEIQKIFDMNLDSPRGLEAMDDKIKAFRENVKANYGELLDANKGKKFNVRGALSQAIREAEDELSNFKNADQVEGIKKGIEYWKDYLSNTSLNINNGWMPIEDVTALRAGVWGAAKFNQASPAGYAEFAEKFGHKINEQLGNRLPEARQLDALLAKTRPMEKATQDAIQRTGNNRIAGITDIIGLTGAVAGAVGSGDLENAKYGLALTLGNRALRSPGFASALYRGANALPAMGANGPLQLTGRRLLGSSFRESEEERRK